MLNASQEAPGGYIEGALLDGLRAAHASVTDFASVADPTRAQLGAAHRLLYIAESSWWWRPLTTPQRGHHRPAVRRKGRRVGPGRAGQGERFAGAGSGTMTGGKGTVTLTIENKADYPMTATIRLAGTGLTLPDGDTLKVELEPGRTPVAVKVVSSAGSQAGRATCRGHHRVGRDKPIGPVHHLPHASACGGGRRGWSSWPGSTSRSAGYFAPAAVLPAKAPGPDRRPPPAPASPPAGLHR